MMGTAGMSLTKYVAAQGMGVANALRAPVPDASPAGIKARVQIVTQISTQMRLTGEPSIMPEGAQYTEPPAGSEQAMVSCRKHSHL